MSNYINIFDEIQKKLNLIINVQIPFSLKYAIIIFSLIVFIDVNIGFGQENELDNTTVSESLLSLKVSSSVEKGSDEFSNVNLTKSVEADNGKLNFKYTIQTPIVDYFDFILALDSSGSLGSVGSPEQKEAILYAVPEFINSTMRNYPNANFRVSIISWDDNIDFASSDFLNDDPKKAQLVPIENARAEILRDDVFNDSENNRFFVTRSNEDTNLSLPIAASIDIFNNNPKIDGRRTSRFVILVVGESEYNPCDDELVKRLYNQSAVVYVIGMPFNERNDLLAHLESLCQYNNSRIQTLSSPKAEMDNALLEALNKALKNATQEPAAENVRIVDSFNGYILPEAKALADIVVGSEKKRMTYQVDDMNDDPNIVDFMLPFGLLPDTITDVKLSTDFMLTGLPTSSAEALPQIVKNNSTQLSMAIQKSPVMAMRFPQVYLRLFHFAAQA